MTTQQAETLTPIRVELVGDHPHAGKRGHLVAGSTPDKVTGIRVTGTFMALVRFDDADGGEPGCYAERRHIRVIGGVHGQ